MNTIYEVADYLVNISDYKTENIQELFKFNDKVQNPKTPKPQKSEIYFK